MYAVETKSLWCWGGVDTRRENGCQLFSAVVVSVRLVQDMVAKRKRVQPTH